MAWNKKDIQEYDRSSTDEHGGPREEITKKKKKMAGKIIDVRNKHFKKENESKPHVSQGLMRYMQS